MILLRLMCYIFLAESIATATRRNSLLWRTMKALNSALDYLDGQIENINLDGAMGARMADDQISVLLNRTTLFAKRRHRQLFRPMFLLQRKAEIFADSAIPVVKRSDPEYFKNIGKILSNGLWLLNYPERLIRTEMRTEVATGERMDEVKSDECISEVVGIEGDEFCPCRISEQCWILMTSHGYSGYSLTHEVIFLQLTDMCMCQRKLEPFYVKYNQSSLANMYETFCSAILNEAKSIVEDYKKTKQDLFMEQIAVCGMIGFVDFYRQEWLKAILSWQLPNGCYAERVDPIWPNETIGRKLRKKREEKVLEGNRGPFPENQKSLPFQCPAPLGSNKNAKKWYKMAKLLKL